MISIEHISKKFRKLQALDNINAGFEPGQVVSLVGPNGSGKTTLIKCILGMVRPDRGDILVNGHSVQQQHGYRKQIGYMPQIGRYPDNMKIRQLFDMLYELRKDEAANADRELIHDFELENIFEKPMRTLSGGTRQKVSAALAFLFNPPILILDEPTAGLDPLAAEILKAKMMKEKKKNKLILITSHILSDLDELTSHIMYMQDGKQLFFKDLDAVREDTGEIKLGRAIARIMKGDGPGTAWNGRMFSVITGDKII